MALHRSPSRTPRRFAAFAVLAALVGGVTFAHARSEPQDGTFASAASVAVTPVPTASPTKNSDNAAANALWDAIGRAEGMAKANLRLGLTETTPGHSVYWGLTQTTPADQLRLLQAVFGEESVLSAEARGHLRGLMGSVTADQDWGISAGLDDSGSVHLKNGWLARSESGLWVVNSIGRVEADGDTLLLAVLCDGQASQKAGISLVEDLAERTRAAVTGG
ncbi:serine hydrolase [Streptomyces sp. DSM 116496]|uniref:serine hydrolase n=1 Tax=Streptomyces stoeckheimensis TaxID=3344656 RepID=UPI0038B34B71